MNPNHIAVLKYIAHTMPLWPIRPLLCSINYSTSGILETAATQPEDAISVSNAYKGCSLQQE